MKISTFNDRLWWLAGREGKITGTRLKDIVVKRGNGEKIGFYALIAEKLGVPSGDEELPMDRGSRLEKEAIARFSEETGKKVETGLTLWQREDNPNIACSPDGAVTPKKKNGKITEAVEVKCLSAARHIEALVTKQIPPEYEYQAKQYFVVNDDLKTLHFVCYDPRFAINPNMKVPIDYFVIELHRKDIEAEIPDLLLYEKTKLAAVDELVNKYSDF